MNILILGSERAEIAKVIMQGGDDFVFTNKKIYRDDELVKQSDFIISFGYRHILRQDILSLFPKSAINIHISLLPWNRGADPNLWSFLEDTPKGVTIHYMDAGIDTGKILCQEEIVFSSGETLRTSYEKLIQLAIKLFEKNWLDIRDGQIITKLQKQGGTYHRSKDRLQYECLLAQGWDTPVDVLIGIALAEDR